MFVYETEAQLPEEPTVRFISTGPQGGDAGHGGEATIEIILPTTGALVVVENDKGETVFEKQPHEVQEHKISITVFGDWELTGLEDAIQILGDLLKQDIEGGKV